MTTSSPSPKPKTKKTKKTATGSEALASSPQPSRAHAAWLHVHSNPAPLFLVSGAYTYIFKNEQQKSDHRRLRGITKTLKTLFWDDYRPPKTASRGEFSRIVGSTPHHHHRQGGVLKKAKCANRRTAQLLGLARGSLIHRQIADYAESVASGRGLQTYYAKHDRRTHPATQKVLEYLIQDLAWQVVGSNVPVFDPTLHFNRWATEIDLVAIDPSSDTLVLVELKTGYDANFYAATGAMKDARLMMNNSPLNQAKIQLVATAMLFDALYPTVADKYGMKLCVVHTTAMGESVAHHWITSAEYRRIECVLRDRWWSYSQHTNDNDDDDDGEDDSLYTGAIPSSSWRSR
jgi:Holliday junction resolvase-like predicted endonuclease